MSNNDPVGIAVVGCGNISDQYLTNLVRFPDVKVLACADLNLERAAAYAAKYGVPRSGDLAAVLAMPDVQMIINLTIPAVHAKVALEAIQAGKHVYGEKPFALSVKEAQTVTEAATQQGIQLGNAPDTFLGAGLQTGRRLIEEGRIGTPISAKAAFGYPGPDAWHPNPEFLFQQGGGPLLDMGPYYLTALVQMLGPIKIVSGFTRRAQSKRSIGSGKRAGETFDVTVDTQVSALLAFASGPIATGTFSFDAPIACRELVVEGTEGIIRLPDPNMFDGSVFLCKKNTQKSSPDEWLEAPTDKDWVEIPAVGSAEGRGMGALEMARALRAGQQPRASADVAMHVLDVMESIASSAASEKAVPIATTFALSDLLPEGWNPLARSV
ncbi:MAG TPA: Gfo/Idh/MocA family oxidoreductase [Terrimicrobiaceae bacterium]|nr:Gfo/Idh/MocA family oxidoreductase [Terrimicrobiaceae bacterium]